MLCGSVWIVDQWCRWQTASASCVESDRPQLLCVNEDSSHALGRDFLISADFSVTVGLCSDVYHITQTCKMTKWSKMPHFLPFLSKVNIKHWPSVSVMWLFKLITFPYCKNRRWNGFTWFPLSELILSSPRPEIKAVKFYLPLVPVFVLPGSVSDGVPPSDWCAKQWRSALSLQTTPGAPTSPVSLSVCSAQDCYCLHRHAPL